MLGRNIVVYFDCSINEDKVEKIKRKKRIKKKKTEAEKRRGFSVRHSFKEGLEETKLVLFLKEE